MKTLEQIIKEHNVPPTNVELTCGRSQTDNGYSYVLINKVTNTYSTSKWKPSKVMYSVPSYLIELVRGWRIMKKVEYRPRKNKRFRDLKTADAVSKDLKKTHKRIDLSQTVIYEPRKKVTNNAK